MIVSRLFSTRTFGTAAWLTASLCIYFWVNADTLREFSPHWHGAQRSWIIFHLCLYALSGLSLSLLLASLDAYLLLGAILLLLALVTTNQVAVDLLGASVLSKETAEWLISESAVVTAAITEFSGPVARHLAICTATLLPFIVIARLVRRRLSLHLLRPMPLALSALVTYGLSGIILYHHFKPFIPEESSLIYYAADLGLRSTPDIPPADLKPARQSEIKKVILVVDETLTHAGYVAQLQKTWAKWHGVDLGDAVSLGNCSASSNSMLRWGFRASHMLAREDPRAAPTVWSYARQTGYETYLIDGQRNGSFQNYMRRKEAALIDQYLGVARGVGTDRAIAELIHALLLKPEKMFIYVNKQGNHFPYTNNYPAGQFPQAKTPEQQYAVSVSYSSQDFLDTMLAGVPLTDTLVIYTSDHGERFDGVGAPHCNGNLAPQEISVPLLLITGNQALAQQAEASAGVLRDHVGHEQIFATLLYALGYDLHAAEEIYGSSLLSTSVPRRYFHVDANPIASKDGPPAVTEIDRPLGVDGSSLHASRTGD